MSSSTMKAIQIHSFGDPDVMKVHDVPIPTPASNQILVKVHSVGINPVDTYIRAGVYAAKPALPYTPGSDAAGVVEAIGSDVKKFKVGDRVYTSDTVTGTYAQYTVAPENELHHLPEKTSFDQGACLSVPYGTAYHALFQRAKGRPGDRLLIHGATGGVGIAAVQFAISRGFEVIGSYGGDQGEDLLKSLGVTKIVNHREGNHYNEVMKLTDGKGVDIILEMLANANLGNDLPVLAFEGRVCVIGSRGPVEINPRDLMGRRADVLGIALRTVTPREQVEITEVIRAGLESNTLKPLIGNCYPLSKAPQVHRDIIHPPQGGASGNLILHPWQED